MHLAKIMKEVQEWVTLGEHYGRQTEARGVTERGGRVWRKKS